MSLIRPGVQVLSPEVVKKLRFSQPTKEAFKQQVDSAARGLVEKADEFLKTNPNATAEQRRGFIKEQSESLGRSSVFLNPINAVYDRIYTINEKAVMSPLSSAKKTQSRILSKVPTSVPPYYEYARTVEPSDKHFLLVTDADSKKLNAVNSEIVTKQAEMAPINLARQAAMDARWVWAKNNHNANKVNSETFCGEPSSIVLARHNLNRTQDDTALFVRRQAEFREEHGMPIDDIEARKQRLKSERPPFTQVTRHYLEESAQK